MAGKVSRAKGSGAAAPPPPAPPPPPPPVILLPDHNPSLLQSYLVALATNPWVMQILSAYEQAKQSNEMLENGLGRVEGATMYCCQKMVETGQAAYSGLVERPVRKVQSVVEGGVEGVKWTVREGTAAATTASTMALGAALVLTQCGLALSAGGLSLTLEGVSRGQDAGRAVAEGVREAEREALAAATGAVKLLMKPVEMGVEGAHSLLDMVESVVERGTGIPLERHETLHSRIATTASNLQQGLSNKAHDEIIDPLNRQMLNLVEELRKSFILLDMVKANKQWVSLKMEEVSESVASLKTRMEEQAAKYRVAPETVLMKAIHSSSNQLSSNLLQLKEKNSKVLGSNGRLDSAIGYLERLEESVRGSTDLYSLRDEVLGEARSQLVSLSARLRASSSPIA